MILLLPQAPEDNPRKRKISPRKADEFVHRMAKVAMVSFHQERRVAVRRVAERRAKSVRSVMENDVSFRSPGRDAYISVSRTCWMGGVRQERRVIVLRVAASSALSV